MKRVAICIARSIISVSLECSENNKWAASLEWRYVQ